MTAKQLLILVFLFMNFYTFITMFADKSSARRGAYRVPERLLFLSAFFFGAVGGTVGIFLFHHKTKHWYFRIAFPILAILQSVVLVYVLLIVK